jgi:hypothetical protein
MLRQLSVLAFATIVALGIGGAPAGAGGSTETRAVILAPPPLAVATWNPNSDNLAAATATIELAGKPIAGVHVRVGDFDVPAVTDAKGQFVYLVDDTLLGRHVVTVTDATGATVGGKALTSSQRAALQQTEASIDVAYTVRDLGTSRNSAGDPVVTGRLVDSSGNPPPPVGLLTYRLTGTVIDSDGKPVSGAQVSTRTLDRDYWTVSTPTDAQGRYSSLFTASSEAPQNPVPFTVRVSVGNTVYQFLPEEFVYFERLKSARLDIRLPPTGYAMAIPRPQSYPGAVYTGIVAAVAHGSTPVRPLSITWPDRSGRFKIVLPKDVAGQTLSLFEADLSLFSPFKAVPGGPVALGEWPKSLPADAPRDVAPVHLSG